MVTRLGAALAMVVFAAGPLSSQDPAQPGQTVRLAQKKAGAPANGGAVRALINGVALKQDLTPLPDAIVRLRDLKANAIEQVATTNRIGEFSFVAKPDVPYVVEIADEAGRILAVGDVLLLNAGEVAGATVALPAHVPAHAGSFADTASAILSAVTGTGLTVVDPTLPKLSPNQ